MLSWVDLIVVLIVGLFALWGWQRGLIFVVTEIIGVAVSLLAAFLTYSGVAVAFAGASSKPGMGKVVAFVAAFLICNMLYWLVVRLLMKRAGKRARKMSKLNRSLGAFLGGAQGVAMAAAAMIALISLPVGVDKEAMAKSVVGPRLLVMGKAIDRTVKAKTPDDIKEGLTFITVTPEGRECIKITACKKVRVDERAEADMLKMLNKERTKRGLKALKMSRALRGIGREHSKDMLNRGYFGHVTPDGVTPFNRISLGKVRYEVAGENLAFAPTTKSAHKGLMESPGHKANILKKDYGKVGIGVYASETEGRMYTQVFTN